MKAKGILFVLLLAILLLSACTPTATVTPTPDVDQIYTAAAQTVIAELTQTAAANTSTPPASATSIALQETTTLVPTSIIATETSLPTNTAIATTTPSETATPDATSAVEPSPTDQFCDNAAWVADVSVQDGTEMSPGQAFEKTWRIKNNGTCVWEAGYKLAFGYGETMNGQARALAGLVAPGATTEVTVVFTAPLTTGSYQSYWRMANAAGANFGEFFYVDIVVR